MLHLAAKKECCAADVKRHNRFHPDGEKAGATAHQHCRQSSRYSRSRSSCSIIGSALALADSIGSRYRNPQNGLALLYPLLYTSSSMRHGQSRAWLVIPRYLTLGAFFGLYNGCEQRCFRHDARCQHRGSQSRGGSVRSVGHPHVVDTKTPCCVAQVARLQKEMFSCD